MLEKSENLLIIFDCDGVLIDSELISIKILHQLFVEYGAKLSEHDVMQRFQGRSLKSALEEVKAEFGVDVPEHAVVHMNTKLFEAFSRELTQVNGVQEFIDSLTSKVCVASSSHPERLEHSLGITSLLRYFDGQIYSATMVKRGKPAPDLFLLAAQDMGYSPQNCVVIEDSPYGILAAKSAGMHAIGITAASHTKAPEFSDKLHKAGADFVATDYKVLSQYLMDITE